MQQKNNFCESSKLELAKAKERERAIHREVGVVLVKFSQAGS